MNKSYRLIYDEARATWVAVAENVSANGKKNKEGLRAAVAGAALVVTTGLMAGQAQAQVVVGAETNPLDDGTSLAQGINTADLPSI